ncbi:PH domain-containing protein [Streptomyces sp. NPDC014734]|uniref:PH domain-containing protein n=1 Tax=Streptomyces sp. NPDC014734 TaxID=3364886 RepID=UPI0036FBF7B1
MTGVRDVSCRPLQKRFLWFLAGLGAIGTILTVLHALYRGPDPWIGAGVLSVLVGIASLHRIAVRVDADEHGVRTRTPLRRRNVPWHDIVDLRVHLKYSHSSRPQEARRVGLLLRDGSELLLPLPRGWSPDDPDFDATLDALRALHRLHGTPRSDHLPVVTGRTAGRGWAGPLSLCALLLVGAGLAAYAMPGTVSDERAWKSAVPCTATTPAKERGECLTALAAVIERTDPHRPKKRSWLYFADQRPVRRLAVSPEAATAFRSGDRVELTVWRGAVRTVAGEHHVWHEHMPAAGDLSAVAAGCVLAAGCPGALLLVRRRGRRLADDEVLPSALPFVGALVGTALWLLPFCYLHPVFPPTSPTTIAWAVAGSLATAGLFAWAWRATRVPAPRWTDGNGGTGGTGTSGESVGSVGSEHGTSDGEEVFVAARFLEHTDYNPHGFGTHIVVGGGSPAVTPHSGPGRFAAIRIPVERLTVEKVRRARGDDGDTVPRSWHIAELDDAGRPVRLAAAPDDLVRVIRAWGPVAPDAAAPTGEAGLRL